MRYKNATLRNLRKLKNFIHSLTNLVQLQSKYLTTKLKAAKFKLQCLAQLLTPGTTQRLAFSMRPPCIAYLGKAKVKCKPNSY